MRISDWSSDVCSSDLPNLGPLQKGPFYAVKIERVAMGVPTAGLPIDTESRVLDASDKPIPGLYAAGNSAAWLDIGGGYNSGIAHTRGLLYGYLVALAMTGPYAAPATAMPPLVCPQTT